MCLGTPQFVCRSWKRQSPWGVGHRAEADGLTHKILFLYTNSLLHWVPRSRRGKEKSVLKLVFLAFLSRSRGLFLCQSFHCLTLVSGGRQLDKIQVLSRNMCQSIQLPCSWYSDSARMRRDLTGMETLNYFFPFYYFSHIKITPSCLWWFCGLKFKYVVVFCWYCFSLSPTAEILRK